MSNQKDLWKGKQYFYNDAQFLGHGNKEQNSSEKDAELLANIMNYDIYQPGFTYTIGFENEIRKINVALAALTNLHNNPLSSEGLVDSASLYLVDNELEKDLVRPFLETFTNYHKLRLCSSVNKLDFCGNGVLLLTLDELPAAVVKLSELNRERNQHLTELLSLLRSVFEKTSYVETEISQLPPKIKLEILEAVKRADLYAGHKILNKTLFDLHERAENLQSFCALDTATYQTKHILITDLGAKEVENTEVTYNYSAVPVGLVFIHSGNLYDNPAYYAKRKYLLDFLKPLIPSFMYWAEFRRQENYQHIEEFSRFPLRNINLRVERANSTYFLQTSGVNADLSRMHFNPMFELQDFRGFKLHNSFNLTNNNTSLRLSPSKIITKLKDSNLTTQMITALQFGVTQRSTLLVVKNHEQAVAKLNYASSLSANLQSAQRNLAVVAIDDLPFYPYCTEIVIIDKDVELTQDHVAKLVSLTSVPQEDDVSGLFIFGSGEIQGSQPKKAKQNKNKSKKHKTTQELEELLEPNLVLVEADFEAEDLTEKQLEVVQNYLRDHRVHQRNLSLADTNFSYMPSLTDNALQAIDYFAHQEHRNWNSQLSSEKALTVRSNNREISYYPNLSNNQFILSCFNNHLFDNPLTFVNTNSELSKSEKFSNYYTNLNLNSGDLVTNISVAIHRIINLFTNRNQRIGRLQNINVVWLLPDGQEDLIPVYEKLFTNIFNKESSPVNISRVSPELIQEIEDKNIVELWRRLKAWYVNGLKFVRTFINFYKGVAPLEIQPEFIEHFDAEMPVEAIFAQITGLINDPSHIVLFSKFTEDEHFVSRVSDLINHSICLKILLEHQIALDAKEGKTNTEAEHYLAFINRLVNGRQNREYQQEMLKFFEVQKAAQERVARERADQASQQASQQAAQQAAQETQATQETQTAQTSTADNSQPQTSEPTTTQEEHKGENKAESKAESKAENKAESKGESKAEATTPNPTADYEFRFHRFPTPQQVERVTHLRRLITNKAIEARMQILASLSIDHDLDQLSQSNIFIATVKQYEEFGLDMLSPDTIVVESMVDLYDSNKSVEFANAVLELFSNGIPANVVMISSPELDAENLMNFAEANVQRPHGFHFKRLSNLNNVYEVPTSERYGYVVDFEAEEFMEPSYQDFVCPEFDAAEVVRQFNKDQQNFRLPQAVMKTFTLPLSAYSLPTKPNTDYLINEGVQLDCLNRFGYIPSMGEKLQELTINYSNFTADKIVNAALNLLLSNRGSKNRGLVVVNHPEIKKFFEQFIQAANISVHDFDSVVSERVIFSHAVVIATAEEQVEQSIIQHVALLTRGFKTPGSIFLFTNATSQTRLLQLLATNYQFSREGRTFYNLKKAINVHGNNGAQVNAQGYLNLNQSAALNTAGAVVSDFVSPLLSLVSVNKGRETKLMFTPNQKPAPTLEERRQPKLKADSLDANMSLAVEIENNLGKRKAKRAKRKK